MAARVVLSNAVGDLFGPGVLHTVSGVAGWVRSVFARTHPATVKGPQS
jgi:hypothetical protein